MSLETYDNGHPILFDTFFQDKETSPIKAVLEKEIQFNLFKVLWTIVISQLLFVAKLILIQFWKAERVWKCLAFKKFSAKNALIFQKSFNCTCFFACN
jgi:hypothetical protein